MVDGIARLNLNFEVSEDTLKAYFIDLSERFE